MTKKTIKKIIWAIDPFAEDEIQLRALKSIRLLTAENETEIEPVTVIMAKQLGSNNAFADFFKSVYLEEVNDKLKKLIDKTSFHKLSKTAFIEPTSTSMRSAAAALTDYACEVKADAIVLTSHARKGIDRLLMGSFVETVMLNSGVPMILVNSSGPEMSKIKNILFATDLRESSKGSYKSLIDFAKTKNSKITLLHEVSFPPIDSTPFLPELGKYMEDEVTHLKKQTKEWEGMARAEGIDVESFVEENSKVGVSAAILEKAKQTECDMIAMVSHMNSVGSFLLGSATRNVLREAKCPVWVMHA